MYFSIFTYETVLFGINRIQTFYKNFDNKQEVS